MSGHTTGPWTVRKNEVLAGQDGVIAVAHSLWPDLGVQCQANARLIAAAPDLLEALKTLLRGYEFLIDSEFGTGRPDPRYHEKWPLIGATEAAIAKAEGK